MDSIAVARIWSNSDNEGDDSMRKQYTQIFKEFFHSKLIRSRDDLGISQEEMAERLEMAGRSYIDLDHGKSGCSAITLVLYLIYICDEPQAFLDELKEAFENCKPRAA